MKFRENLKKEFDIEVVDVLTLSSLAVKYQQMKGCFDGCFKLGLYLRKFISQCIVGGRCMTCENKMWRVKKPIVDFDGVSLYPSSMSRVWYPAGKPEKLSPEQIAFFSRVENLPPEGPSPSGEGSETEG